MQFFSIVKKILLEKTILEGKYRWDNPLVKKPNL